MFKKAPILRIPSLKKIGIKSNPLGPVDALRIWLKRTKTWTNPVNRIWMNAATKVPANARLLGVRLKALIQISHNDVTWKFPRIKEGCCFLSLWSRLVFRRLLCQSKLERRFCFLQHYCSPQSVKQICIAMGKRLN